jgi:hypothetical protein
MFGDARTASGLMRKHKFGLHSSWTGCNHVMNMGGRRLFFDPDITQFCHFTCLIGRTVRPAFLQRCFKCEGFGADANSGLVR